MKVLSLLSIVAVLFIGGVAIAQPSPDTNPNKPPTEQIEQNPIQDSVETQVCKRFFGCW